LCVKKKTAVETHKILENVGILRTLKMIQGVWLKIQDQLQKYVDWIVRDHQVTLRLVEDQNITFKREMIHQILRRNGRD
jgi:hypothetical protein